MNELAPAGEARTGAAPARPSVVVVIPAYNEQDAIRAPSTTSGVFSTRRASSTRSSSSTMAPATIPWPRRRSSGARLIDFPDNIGYGHALKAGIAASDSDLVAILDADGTYPPEALPAMIAMAAHSRHGRRRPRRGDEQRVRGCAVQPNGYSRCWRASWPSADQRRQFRTAGVPPAGARAVHPAAARRLFVHHHDHPVHARVQSDGRLSSDRLRQADRSLQDPGAALLQIPVYLVIRLTVFFQPLRIFLPLGAILFVVGARQGVLRPGICRRSRSSRCSRRDPGLVAGTGGRHGSRGFTSARRTGRPERGGSLVTSSAFVTVDDASEEVSAGLVAAPAVSVAGAGRDPVHPRPHRAGVDRSPTAVADALDLGPGPVPDRPRGGAAKWRLLIGEGVSFPEALPGAPGWPRGESVPAGPRGRRRGPRGPRLSLGERPAATGRRLRRRPTARHLRPADHRHGRRIPVASAPTRGVQRRSCGCCVAGVIALAFVVPASLGLDRAMKGSRARRAGSAAAHRAAVPRWPTSRANRGRSRCSASPYRWPFRPPSSASTSPSPSSAARSAAGGMVLCLVDRQDRRHRADQPGGPRRARGDHGEPAGAISARIPRRSSPSA